MVKSFSTTGEGDGTVKITKNSIEQQTGRSNLAGAGDRQADGADGVDGHARAPGETGAARRFRGTRSTGWTCPAEIRPIAAATVTEGPRARNLNFRTLSGEIVPMSAAMPASDSPALRMKSRNSIGLHLPTQAPRAPAVLTPTRLAEVLAILASELVDVMPVADRGAARERLANRLDGLGRTPGGSEAAGMLGAVGGAMMRMEG